MKLGDILNESVALKGLVRRPLGALALSISSSTALLLLPLFSCEAQDTKAPQSSIGISTALTGSATALGLDMRNAITLVNETEGRPRYKLVFEDEQCDNTTAVTVAHKLIDRDKVRYVLGFPCNSSLLATAPLYSKANVVVVTSAATSGDVQDIGKGIFRLFPSDVNAAELLFRHIAKKEKRVGVLTEQNEFTVMMERVFRGENKRLGKPVQLVSEEFVHGETDLKGVLLRLLKGGIDGLYINANTDESFIAAMKQVKAMKFRGTIYSAYLPASEAPRRALGSALNGVVFVNLPQADDVVTESGKALLTEFRKRFGEPQSGFPIVPLTFEAYRVVDLAIQSGKNPSEFISSTTFTGGFIRDFHFDAQGAVHGIDLQIQKIDGGKVLQVRE